MRYDLYYGRARVGVVTQTDADFPNLWGDIDYDPGVSAHPRLARFVALSREVDRVSDRYSVEGPEVDALQTELEGYDDLIESADWWLVDAAGRPHPILVPNFCHDGVVWRWDFDRPGGPFS